MSGLTFHSNLRRTLVAAAVLQFLALPAGAVDYTWNSGYLSSSGLPGTIGPADTLSIGNAGPKIVDVNLTTQGAVSWLDHLYFQWGATITNSGTWAATADTSLIDNYAGGTFDNSGIFAKTGGAGTTSVGSGIRFINSGTVNAQIGAISFNSGNATFNAGSQFTGAGVVQVTSNAAFNGGFSSQNLVLAGGSFNGTGALIGGSVNWTGGTMTGDWAVNAGSTLKLLPGGDKVVIAALTNGGTIVATDHAYFEYGVTLANQNLYDMQGDVGLYNAYAGGTFNNSGTLRKSAGTGTSAVGSGMNFVNSGTIEAQTGTISFDSGVATFNAGTHFTGAGQVAVANSARFVGDFTSHGNLTLLSGGFTGGDGTADSKAVANGDFNWASGAMYGSWEVAAGSTLTIKPLATKSVIAALVNKGTIAAEDHLHFQYGYTLANQSLYDMQGDVGLYNAYAGGTFNNSGTLRKSAGTGTSSVGSGVTFVNSGTIEVQMGTISFDNGLTTFNDGTRFIGAGQVAATSNARFAGGFTTNGNLTLSGANFTGGDGSPGSKAVVNGDFNWASGALYGSWEVAAGSTVTLKPPATKSINAEFTNKGTIAAEDHLHFQYGYTLANQSLYDMQGDVGLYNAYAGGTFNNSGTLRKSAGTGTSSVGSGVTFVNSGTIEAQLGTISFDSGGATFNAGSRFVGAGLVVVTNHATFNGALQAQNLQLAGGTLTGGDAQVNGSVKWTGGALAGTWAVAPGATVQLQPGAGKTIIGSVTNQGTMQATDSLGFEYGYTLTNQGVYDLRGDFGFYDAYAGGAFVNAGMLVKSAGSGTSSLSGIAFTNVAGGVVDVRSGTVQLPANFTNQGTLKGEGAFQTNLLTNAGHVAPGDSPGTLTLNGNFAQTAGGSFDVELGGLAGADLLTINGSAFLDGTLDLICFGACSYSVGQQITILSYTGALAGTFAGSPVLTGFAAGAFTVSYATPNAVMLTVTEATVPVVPEPGAWAMMLAGLGVLGLLASRRRP